MTYIKTDFTVNIEITKVIGHLAKLYVFRYLALCHTSLQKHERKNKSKQKNKQRRSCNAFHLTAVEYNRSTLNSLSLSTHSW